MEGQIFKDKTIWDKSVAVIVPQWHSVLQKLRENGFILAVLTNNFHFTKAKSGKTTSLDPEDFDAIFESCKLGMRKPDRNIYEHVLSELKVREKCS